MLSAVGTKRDDLSCILKVLLGARTNERVFQTGGVAGAEA